MLRIATRLLCVAALLALVPSAASAATFNFFSTDGLGPSGGAGTFGPATSFPSSIEVAGLQGPLTKVTATMIGFGSGSPDDVDMLLVGPEGEQVMLMSDACGETQFFTNSTWTFDDGALVPLPDNGPCPSDAAASFKPSNYVGNAPEPDQFGVGGGIFPPYDETLSAFVGTDPNGPWDLYVRDDREGVVGFGISGWALTLTTADPPPTGAPPTSTPPASSPPSSPVTTPSAPSPPTAEPTKTGRRAAALKRCKRKATKAKRMKCRARARKLPV